MLIIILVQNQPNPLQFLPSTADSIFSSIPRRWFQTHQLGVSMNHAGPELVPSRKHTKWCVKHTICIRCSWGYHGCKTGNRWSHVPSLMNPNNGLMATNNYLDDSTIREIPVVSFTSYCKSLNVLMVGVLFWWLDPNCWTKPMWMWGWPSNGRGSWSICCGQMGGFCGRVHHQKWWLKIDPWNTGIEASQKADLSIWGFWPI